MKCEVVSVIPGEIDTSLDIGDEVKMVAGEAQAFADGRLILTLLDARVMQIGDKWIAIEGFTSNSAANYELQRWWCAVGDGKDGAK